MYCRVHYVEKGPVFDFKRIDHERCIVAYGYFIHGGLYYFKLNEYNYKTIAKEDIINIEEVYENE